ncbi:MAG: hypothetical protein M1837_000782 [Sclerophora amabilis]|nr:MAG: hypothetical protein M1837_000782 [Sclerophora amabilis]
MEWEEHVEEGVLNVLNGGAIRLYFTLQLQRVRTDTVVTHLKKTLNFPVSDWLWEQPPETVLLYIAHDFPEGILDAAIQAMETFSFLDLRNYVPPSQVEPVKPHGEFANKKPFSREDFESWGDDPLARLGFHPDEIGSVETIGISQSVNPVTDPEICRSSDKQLKVIFATARSVRNSRIKWEVHPGDPVCGGVYIMLGWNHPDKHVNYYRPPAIRDGKTTTSYS